MIRTLVVDDDPVAADAHTMYVQRVAGFVVAARAATGADALRRVADTPLELVLLDVHLPDMSGLEVLRRIRAAGRTVDVVMVTRARDLAVVQAAVSFGATQYLVKPFTAGAVRAKLEAFRAYRERLGEEVVLAQGDVDALLDTLRGPGGDLIALPKGVSRESLAAAAAVLEAAAPGSGRTAAEVASALGASRVTARRYLEHLVASGLAERQARYGDTGRPQTEYHWRPRPRGHGR